MRSRRTTGVPDVWRFDETGDDPPRDRTAELRALGFPTRHLGPVQMTTDTALGVTKRVIVDRGSLVPHRFLAMAGSPYSAWGY